MRDAAALAERIAEAVPTTWLDSLLTGPEKVGDFGNKCPAVERLLRAVKDRVLAAALRSLRPPADATGTALCACGEHPHSAEFLYCLERTCPCKHMEHVADRYTYTVPRDPHAVVSQED